MARFLTAVLLLAFVAAAAAQGTAVPTGTPTSTPTVAAPTPAPTLPTPFIPVIPTPAPTVPTGIVVPTPMPTVMPAATMMPAATPMPTAPTTPTVTMAPTTKPSSSPSVPKSCKDGEYLKKSTNMCNTCVSTKTTGARTSIGRSTCYNPTASGRVTSCSGAHLTGAHIRATMTKTKSVSCIPKRPQGGVVVIYLPRKGTYKLKFLTAAAYIKSSFRLNGSIPASVSRGRVISSSETFLGKEMLKISFNDKFGTLSKKAGQMIYLRGVVRRPGALLDYCFYVPFKVCK